MDISTDSLQVVTATVKKHHLSKLLPAGMMSIGAFAAGFDVCLFDVSNAPACVAVAESWVEPFRQFGMGIIEWGIAIFKAL